MHLLRLVLAGVVVGWPGSLFAQTATPPPFVLDKAFSADLAITTKEGMVIQTKIFVDGDKLRGGFAMNGMQMVAIVRKDKQKIYEVMDAQKMVMAMDYDPAKFMGGRTAAAFGPTGTFELIGPDTVDGVACTKYKVTAADKAKDVSFFWLDTARKIPVEVASENGSFTAKVKNYVAGPQDPALFEIPPDYQVMAMPGMPGAGGEGP